MLYNTDVDAGHMGQKFALITHLRGTNSDLTFCKSYKDGTSTNREPCKAAEVGHSQLWAQPWVMLADELLNRTGFTFLYY